MSVAASTVGPGVVVGWAHASVTLTPSPNIIQEWTFTTLSLIATRTLTMIIIGSTIICGPDTGALSPAPRPPRPAPPRPVTARPPHFDCMSESRTWGGGGDLVGAGGTSGGAGRPERGRARAGVGGGARGAPLRTERPWTTLRRDSHITTANSQRTHDFEARRARRSRRRRCGAGRGRAGWGGRHSSPGLREGGRGREMP